MAMARWLLPDASSTNQDHVAFGLKKASALKIANQCFVDWAFGEDKVGQFLGHRQMSCPDLVANRARLLLGEFGLEQIAEQILKGALAADGVAQNFVEDGAHAGQMKLQH